MRALPQRLNTRDAHEPRELDQTEDAQSAEDLELAERVSRIVVQANQRRKPWEVDAVKDGDEYGDEIEPEPPL